MKKLIIFILILILCLTGCSYKIDLHDEITEIKYNDLTIIKEDYDNIKKLINNKYYNNKPDEKFTDKLSIKTTKNLYSFNLSDNYISINNYYSKNTKLNNYLKKLEDKYQNKDFYEISYQKNNNQNNQNNEVIKLDNTSNQIIINFNEKIKNFKINQINYTNNKYEDIDLLYSKENINDKVIIGKTISYDNPDIRISFTNKYNYEVSIIPTYNNQNKVIFKTTYKHK